MYRQGTTLSEYSKEKKFEKILSCILNPLLQNHILAQVVNFFIVGHIYEIVINIFWLLLCNLVALILELITSEVTDLYVVNCGQRLILAGILMTRCFGTIMKAVTYHIPKVC